MSSPHKPDAHRDIAAATLASLAATLVAIQAHAGDVHEDMQTSSPKQSDQDDSGVDTDARHASPMSRSMS